MSKEAYAACVLDCCVAECVAAGGNADLCRRNCSPKPAGLPKNSVSCSQHCRGKHGTNTKAYFRCMAEICEGGLDTQRPSGAHVEPLVTNSSPTHSVGGSVGGSAAAVLHGGFKATLNSMGKK